MNLRRILGLSFVVTAASVALPAMLSAQNNAGTEQPQVRIKLLDSGDIQITGEFILESDGALPTTVVRVSGTSLITDPPPGTANATAFLGTRATIQAREAATSGKRNHYEVRLKDARIYRPQ